MRTNAKNAVALSLAIAGAVASPMRSDAVSRKGSPPPHCRVASYAQPKGLSRAFYRTAHSCAAAASISKVATLVEEYKLVASQPKGKKKTDPGPEPTPKPEASAP